MWGNATFAPDDTSHGARSHGELISFRESVIAAEGAGSRLHNMTADDASTWILERTSTQFQVRCASKEEFNVPDDNTKQMIESNYSFGIERDEEQLKRNNLDPRKWSNPLEIQLGVRVSLSNMTENDLSRLPNAPTTKFYCVYGHGKDTEVVSCLTMSALYSPCPPSTHLPTHATHSDHTGPYTHFIAALTLTIAQVHPRSIRARRSPARHPRRAVRQHQRQHHAPRPARPAAPTPLPDRRRVHRRARVPACRQRRACRRGRRHREPAQPRRHVRRGLEAQAMEPRGDRGRHGRGTSPRVPLHPRCELMHGGVPASARTVTHDSAGWGDDCRPRRYPRVDGTQ